MEGWVAGWLDGWIDRYDKYIDVLLSCSVVSDSAISWTAAH